ncbi:MAG TPA: CvpA family protein [Dehalococcoidia bacterium]|nr:CvpA family protein [Dehalococcoidia bacterium]
MNWLDIVIIVVAVLLGIAGLRQGIIRTVFGIAGLIGGIVLAGRYYDELAVVLSSSGATWVNIAAYAIILIATLIVAGVIGRLVAKLVHFVLLGWLDRLVGCVLGVFIGGLLCAAVLAIVLKYYPGTEAVISQSGLAKFLMGGFPLLLALLPGEFDFIRDFFITS